MTDRGQRMATRLALPALVATLVLAGCGGGGASSPTTTAQRASASMTGAAASTTAAAPATTSAAAPATTGTAATAATTTTLAQGVDPNAPEVVEPGDIPDNQVFVPYRPPGATFEVKVPEGWAQTGSGASTTFTDHYNSIVVTSTSASQAPTVAEVRDSGLADVAANPTFHLTGVTDVERRSGPGVLATYEIGSDPNPVTGKRALLAVERYEFFHGGRVVTLTLSGARGADNVDPWRTVTDSLTWS
jgi:hypothetical protein